MWFILLLIVQSRESICKISYNLIRPVTFFYYLFFCRHDIPDYGICSVGIFTHRLLYYNIKVKAEICTCFHVNWLELVMTMISVYTHICSLIMAKRSIWHVELFELVWGDGNFINLYPILVRFTVFIIIKQRKTICKILKFS